MNRVAFSDPDYVYSGLQISKKKSTPVAAYRE